MENLKMIRMKAKLKELFGDKIDVTDVKNEQEKENKYFTRAIAALEMVITCGIDYESASTTITDGYHDIGIDAIYNDCQQKKLILVQSKWRNDGNGGVSQTEISPFIEGIKRIINLNFEGCNGKIKSKQQEITSAISDMDYQIEMILCHTGNQNIDTYVYSPIKELLNQINEDESSKLLIFTEHKLQDLYEFLANGQNTESITLPDVLLHNWGTIDSPLKAYYGTIPVSALGDWYQKYGNKLFEKNIRYYKGNTEVNQGIKDVLKTEPENFFYYNNGIKLLCKKITKKAAYSTNRSIGLFVLEGVSLVNGAQTTGAIGTIYAETPEILSSAYIFIQMIDLGDSNKQQAIQITKLSNTQNKIEGKDFVSLDSNQERIRMELNLSGIQYIYKSGAKVEYPDKQISLDEAIVAQACSIQDLAITALVKRNIGALTENIEKAPYKQLFNDLTNSFSLYNNVIILRAVDSCISKHSTQSTGRKRLVLIHGNRYLLHLIIREISKEKNFNTQLLEKDYIFKKVNSIFNTFWDETYTAMEKYFKDSYPAHIFKNVGRLKEIYKDHKCI